MVLDLITAAICTVTIFGGLCYLLYGHYRKKKAMRKLIERYLQDSFAMEQDCMEAYQAMIRKACLENAKENLCNKD